jgi:uncharacterized caspase-like protein
VALVGLILMVIGFSPLYAQSAPESRIALVIGNSLYASSALRLPAGDTTLVAGALAAAGFRVTLMDDLGQAEMQQAVTDFATALQGPNTVGLFYYAGHGAQYGGTARSASPWLPT